MADRHLYPRPPLVSVFESRADVGAQPPGDSSLWTRSHILKDASLRTHPHAPIRRAIPLLMRPLTMLMCPLTEELVLAALERMPRGSSPGVDGVITDVYKKFPTIFVPRLLSSL